MALRMRLRNEKLFTLFSKAWLERHQERRNGGAVATSMSVAGYDRWIALVRTDANRLVQLRHKSGHSVWANMSKSAVRRHDDTVALSTLDDRMEDLWLNSIAPDHDTGRSTNSASLARW